MEYFAGLDISLETTSICIVDGDGAVVKEAKVASEPADLVTFFARCRMTMKRIGLEAGHHRNGSTVAWPKPVCRSFVRRLPDRS